MGKPSVTYMRGEYPVAVHAWYFELRYSRNMTVSVEDGSLAQIGLYQLAS